MNSFAFWQQVKYSLLSFVYPPSCLHCQEFFDPPQLLCFSCVNLLELIDDHDRCSTCFTADYEKNGHCADCKHSPRLFYRMAAAFDYIGPAASLIRKLKYGNQPYLAAGVAAFLVTQFDRLNWPMPDALVPVPLSLNHWIQRGYNQSLLIANQMANFLNIPVWNVLERKNGDYSQAGLSLAQRRKLGGKTFKLKQGYSLQDKTLLVVDDVMTTGSTLNKCAETLMEGFPHSLYALTVCRALR
jgi:ComF family protein